LCNLKTYPFNTVDISSNKLLMLLSSVMPKKSEINAPLWKIKVCLCHQITRYVYVIKSQTLSCTSVLWET
jgi:hypothetical protein